MLGVYGYNKIDKMAFVGRVGNEAGVTFSKGIYRKSHSGINPLEWLFAYFLYFMLIIHHKGKK
uniref:Uncharacterized protein n=1 Tax=Lactobacillus johnsonii TaxID=33959 RepID=A0A9W3SNG8_LACJH|nr:hypothetical protein BBP16_09620 [Lactobacillus johnsonii]